MVLTSHYPDIREGQACYRRPKFQASCIQFQIIDDIRTLRVLQLPRDSQTFNELVQSGCCCCFSGAVTEYAVAIFSGDPLLQIICSVFKEGKPW